MEVTLPDKKIDEFCLFYQHLQGCQPVTVPNAVVLCGWADEYQVEGLKAVCDTVLTNDVLDVKRMILACKFNLPQLLAKYKKHYLQDGTHILGLNELVETHDGAAALAQLWPDISKTLGIQCKDPPPDSVKHMWPILEQLVIAQKEAETCRSTASAANALISRLRSSVSIWHTSFIRRHQHHSGWHIFRDNELDFLYVDDKQKAAAWFGGKIEDLKRSMDAIK